MNLSPTVVACDHFGIGRNRNAGGRIAVIGLCGASLASCGLDELSAGYVACRAGMIGIEPKQGHPFCIDALEVTERDWAHFRASGSTPAVPPSGGCDGTISTHVVPASDAVPVSRVSWCDAYAYCAWANKRLCGALGGGGKPIDSVQGEWYAACSHDGDDPAASWQNSCYWDPTKDYPAASDGKRCEGPYPGLFDMIGNVLEWENSCDSNALDATCDGRGGDYKLATTNLRDECYRCDSLGATCATQDRQQIAPARGFRCCANP